MATMNQTVEAMFANTIAGGLGWSTFSTESMPGGRNSIWAQTPSSNLYFRYNDRGTEWDTFWVSDRRTGDIGAIGREAHPKAYLLEALFHAACARAGIKIEPLFTAAEEAGGTSSDSATVTIQSRHVFGDTTSIHEGLPTWICRSVDDDQILTAGSTIAAQHSAA